MPGIWSNDGAGWKLLSTRGFPDEARLHSLVEEAPQLLPLAGAPQLAVVGREVHLGTGYADILAVETTGRLAVIEVKLARNAEARRAIVSQVLAYAAYLHGVEVSSLESQILAKHLHDRGYESLLDAARKNDQEGAVDAASFTANLSTFLAEGRFRLVFVLDDAPPELVRLVAYLEAVSDKILIDLVTVSAFDVGGSQVLMPQRVDAEPTRSAASAATPPGSPGPTGQIVEGAADFEATIDGARPESREDLRRYTAWAKSLEAEGLVRLQTYIGPTDRTTLLPRLKAEGVGMATIWNDHGAGYIQLWRTVIERHAPTLVASLEALIAPTPLKQGNVVRGASQAVLDTLHEAYRLAAGPDTVQEPPEVAE